MKCIIINEGGIDMDERDNMFWNSEESAKKEKAEFEATDGAPDALEDGEGFLFVNEYLVKEEHIKEFYCRSLRSPIFIIGCIISVIVVSGVTLWTLFVGFDAMWAFVGVIWLLYPLLRIYLCFRSISLYKQRLKESYGGELPPQTYCFLEDCVVNGENTTQKVFYVNIKKVILTKNLILLRTGSNLIHIIPRDSFVKGNEKDFLDFMRKKEIKIKGK